MSQSNSFFDVQPIMAPLQGGQLILTPNQRLASHIRSAYAISSRELGQNVVQAPAVFSLAQWLDQCWQQLLIDAVPLAIDVTPLTTGQELALWEKIVSGSNIGSVLLRPSATAQQAARAYRLLLEWRQSLNQENSSSVRLRPLFAADPDCAVLLGWVDQFEHACQERCWIVSAQRGERLITAFETAVLPSAGPILGVGFENIAPLYQALVNSAGRFSHYNSPRQQGAINVLECETQKQEFLAAAVWAKQRLKDNPTTTIGIVVPELASQRHIVQRLLHEVFEPGYKEPITVSGETNQRHHLPFNFSVGSPLLEAPIITAAINALSLSLPVMDVDNLLAICQSPFYCLTAEDQAAITSLIRLVRDEREFSLSTSRFRQLANKVSEKLLRNEPLSNCPDDRDQSWIFASALQQQAVLCRSFTLLRSRPIHQWLELFNDLLSAIGWPGKRSLDSIEYQQVSQWQQALDEFASLQLLSTPLAYSEALSQLRGILSRHIFQPKTADSPLQILGTLEASGLQFEHLWLTSMSEQQWPAAPAANPLLPYSLQRELKMPHATAEGELEYAASLSQRFISNAKNIVVSSPGLIDGNSVAISSFFKTCPTMSMHDLLGRELETLNPINEIRRRHFESQNIEVFEAGSAPVLPDGAKVSGGTSLFNSQAACPFKAFSRHRLQLKALPEPYLGLNAADRGSLLHRALELTWQKLKTRQALLAMDDKQQDELCAEISNYAVTEIAQRKPSRVGPRFMELENQRLHKLLQGWLNVERERADFFVDSIEDCKAFRFQQLQLETRIDRIDRLDDGSLIIIDYKTAKSSVSSWWGERPDDSQLPLYIMLIEQGGNEVGGIAFAQVRMDGCSLKGVGAENLPETSVQWRDKLKTDTGAVDWQQLKQRWRSVLTALAKDFIAGRADVDPKKTPQTCQYCDFSSLCRVAHQPVQPL